MQRQGALRLAQMVSPLSGGSPFAQFCSLSGMQASSSTQPDPHMWGPLSAHRANQSRFGLSALPSGLLRPTSVVLGWRGFASQGISLTQDVLQQVQIVKLREELAALAEGSLSIPYTTFLEVAKGCGATSDAEAADQCAALHKAGIVLRHQDVVYLRAEEVADMVMLMLPGGKEEAQVKLSKVESELAALDQVHDSLERSSHRWTDAMLVTGLVVLVTQFVLFIWLTWWELSWDVMEPIAYIISLFYSVVAYIYFLFTRHNFDLGPMQKFWAGRFKERAVAKAQFDADHYQYLRKVQQRYKRHLASIKIR